MQKGFSLIEVIIAISIIMLISAIAIPSLQGYTANYNLKSAAREIQGDFFLYKEMAVSENRRYRISFNIANNEYTIQQCQGADTCLFACSSPCNYVIIQRKNFGNNMQLTNASFTAGSPTVTFLTKGVPTGFGGSVRLTNTRGSSATITVNMTGRISVNFDMR